MAKGLKTGGRRRGTPNKVTAEIREYAQQYTVEAPEDLARDAHFVVTPEDAVDRAEAQAFRAWLIVEARGEGVANPARRKGRGGN